MDSLSPIGEQMGPDSGSEEQTWLVIISGPPGTGKTTLGRRVATCLGLPFINKDSIKEILFDTLGWSDREWSRRLGVATYALLYYVVEEQLKAGKSLVVESNFAPEQSTPNFRALQAKYRFEPFQVQCITEGETLLARFRARYENGERHPGHVDAENYDSLREILLRGRYDSLDIGGEVYEVDTTDFAAVDYGAICRAIESRMGRA